MTMSVPGIGTSSRPIAKVGLSNWCQVMDPLLAGVRDPRAIATSSAAGMVSVNS